MGWWNKLFGKPNRPRRCTAGFANSKCDQERGVVRGRATSFLFARLGAKSCPGSPSLRGILQLFGIADRPRRSTAVHASSCDRERPLPPTVAARAAFANRVGGTDHFPFGLRPSSLVGRPNLWPP